VRESRNQTAFGSGDKAMGNILAGKEHRAETAFAQLPLNW